MTCCDKEVLMLGKEQSKVMVVARLPARYFLEVEEVAQGYPPDIFSELRKLLKATHPTFSRS